MINKQLITLVGESFADVQPDFNTAFTRQANSGGCI